MTRVAPRGPARRRLPALACLSTLALVVGACGGDDDGASGATTSVDASTTTAAPTTTQPATTETTVRPCEAVGVPAGAAEVTEAAGDVDGDGAEDSLRGYLLDEADWHLQVALAAGGGADLSITTFGGASVAVLGGADVDGDGGDELWARTGSGASAAIIGLARFTDCALVRVTFAGGEPAEFAVGGSVGTAAGLACAALDATADLTSYTATNVVDDQYDVTAVEYALDGTTLVERGTEAARVSTDDDAFTQATTFTCGDLSL